jgi:TRAP-type transport system periplasmic protein
MSTQLSLRPARWCVLFGSVVSVVLYAPTAGPPPQGAAGTTPKAEVRNVSTARTIPHAPRRAPDPSGLEAAHGAMVFQLASAEAQAVIELRAGTTNPKGNVVSNGVDKFAELVAAKTNGEVRVRVFYQSLGVEKNLAEAVMAGSVDIGQFGQANAASHTTAFFVYNLPFVFTTYDGMLRSLAGPTGRKAIEQFENDLGVKVLFTGAFGSGRDIETRKRIRTPADLKGVKIRTNPTPVDQFTFRAWGANPTPVDTGQLYTALQQGVVDGMQSDVAFFYAIKAHEAVKHVLRLEWQMDFTNIFINSKKLAALSGSQQKAILEAGKEAGAWEHQHAAEGVERILQLLRDAGVEIYKPSPQEYAEWTASREKVWQDVGAQLKGKIDLKIARQLHDEFK